MRVRAPLICCASSITRASRCRGSGFRVPTSVSAGEEARPPASNRPCWCIASVRLLPVKARRSRSETAVSVADVWTEISQPPYFVAYHGACHRTSRSPSLPAPPSNGRSAVLRTALMTGAEWKLKAQDGLGSTLHVQALTGDHATILDRMIIFRVEPSPSRPPGANGAWSIEKMHYDSAKETADQGLTISFAPGTRCHRGTVKIRGDRRTQDAHCRRHGTCRPGADTRGVGVQGSRMAARQDRVGRQRVNGSHVGIRPDSFQINRCAPCKVSELCRNRGRV